MTPDLDQANANHIGSDKAADFVLLRWQAIDGRHPFFVDPLSWRALLSRYDVLLNASNALLMGRRPDGRYGELQPVGSTTAAWGEEITVPQQEPILVMETHTDTSLLGGLKRLLFRVHPVYVEVRYSSGNTMRWRVVRSNLANGVIVNPLPTGLQDVVSLLETGGSDLGRVKSLRFEASVPHEFEPTILVRWYSLPLQQPLTQEAGFGRLPQDALIPLWLPGDGRPHVAGGHVLTVNPQWLTVRSTTIDPQLTFEIGSSLGQYEMIIIRARFEKADRIHLFFGRQVDGRGLSRVVFVINQWLDVYINVGMNPFWRSEHGTNLRFDPSSADGVGSTIDIAGVWGSTVRPASVAPGMVFHAVPDSEAQRQP